MPSSRLFYIFFITFAITFAIDFFRVEKKWGNNQANINFISILQGHKVQGGTFGGFVGYS